MCRGIACECHIECFILGVGTTETQHRSPNNGNRSQPSPSLTEEKLNTTHFYSHGIYCGAVALDYCIILYRGYFCWVSFLCMQEKQIVKSRIRSLSLSSWPGQLIPSHLPTVGHKWLTQHLWVSACTYMALSCSSLCVKSVWQRLRQKALCSVSLGVTHQTCGVAGCYRNRLV